MESSTISDVETLADSYTKRFPFEKASFTKKPIPLKKLFKYLFLKPSSDKKRNLSNTTNLPPKTSFSQASDCEGAIKRSLDLFVLCESESFNFLLQQLLEFLYNSKISHIKSASCWVITSSREIMLSVSNHKNFHVNPKSRVPTPSIKFIYAPTIQSLRAFFSTLHISIYGATLPKTILLLDFFHYREQASCLREFYDLLNLVFLAFSFVRNGASRKLKLTIVELLPDLATRNEAGVNGNSATMEGSLSSDGVIAVALKSAAPIYSKLFGDFSLLAGRDYVLSIFSSAACSQKTRDVGAANNIDQMVLEDSASLYAFSV